MLNCCSEAKSMRETEVSREAERILSKADDSISKIESPLIRSMLFYVREHALEAYLEDYRCDTYDEYLEEQDLEGYSEVYRVLDPEYNESFFDLIEKWASSTGQIERYGYLDNIIEDVGGFDKMAELFRLAGVDSIDLRGILPTEWCYNIARGAIVKYDILQSVRAD